MAASGSRVGSRWFDSEVECLIDIWADDSIQSQLEKTHKNSEVFGEIRDHLERLGHHRTVAQCRDKVKKLRIQYLKVRDALRRSGSSAEEKDRFQWYDAVDQIIGHKPSSEPTVLESAPVCSRLECPTEDNKPGTPLSDSSLCPEEEDTNALARSPSSAGTPPTSSGPVTRLPTSSRKRKRRTTARSDATSDIMGTFLDLQRQQHAEHMEAERLRHSREMEMFAGWMSTQREMEERRQQENRNMFQQLYAALTRTDRPPTTTTFEA